jgi:hypothetical protein
MILTKIIMTATMSKMWMKPPMVYEVTMPRSHRIMSITANKVNIEV